jgi:hypothetical protein
MKGLIQFVIGTTVVTLGGFVAYGLCLPASFLIAGLIGARGTNHIISGLPVLPAFAIWIWLSRWRSGAEWISISERRKGHRTTASWLSALARLSHTPPVR